MDLNVTIVRHGDTFAAGAPLRRIGARTDLPLVASGHAQARALGQAFAAEGRKFDLALTAPLSRTRDTLDLILAQQSHVPPIESVDWLTEIDHGPDEGRLESEVIARVGQHGLAAWDSDAIAPDGWIVDQDSRIAGWRGLWDGDVGRILIVTSNGAARFALRSCAALRRQAMELPSLKLRTGAYGTIARVEGAMRLIAWDCRP